MTATKGRKSVRIEVDDPETETPPPPQAPTGAYVAPPPPAPVPQGEPQIVPIFAELAQSDAIAFIRVVRITPKEPPYGGFIGDYPPDLATTTIQQIAGGGSYRLTLFDRSGRSRAETTERIGGLPRIPADPNAPTQATPAPAAGQSMGELKSLFADIMATQAKNNDSAMAAMRQSRDDREAEFKQFYLLVKEQNTSLFTMMMQGNQAMLTTITTVMSKSGEATINAISQLATGALELAKGGGKGEGGLDDVLKLSKELQRSPWEMPMMMLLMSSMGGGKGEGGGGAAMPPEMLMAMMGREPPKIEQKTPEKTAEKQDPDEDDPVGDYVEWLANTPDEVLGPAILARARDGSTPPAVMAAMDAAFNGNQGPILSILADCNSADLAPRIQRVGEQLRAAQAAAAGRAT